MWFVPVIVQATGTGLGSQINKRSWFQVPHVCRQERWTVVGVTRQSHRKCQAHIWGPSFYKLRCGFWTMHGKETSLHLSQDIWRQYSGSDSITGKSLFIMEVVSCMPHLINDCNGDIYAHCHECRGSLSSGRGYSRLAHKPLIDRTEEVSPGRLRS